MLHNKMNYIIKPVVVALCVMCVVLSNAFAGTSTPTTNKGSFNVQKNSTLTWGISDYLLDGCSSPSSFDNSCRGTYDDEGAIVVNMAREFNDKGGYFCPTQIQFGNSNGQTRIWVNLHNPKDFSESDCKWICVDGYKGENCAETDDGTIVDDESMTLLKKGTSRKSGGMDNHITDDVDIFAKSEHTSNSSDRGAWIHVLAILKYMDHGVLVGHLWVYGTRDYGCLWGSCIKSWVTKVHGETNNGREVLMCADGYRVVNNQCGLISENPVPKPMCAGWTEQEYKANETDLEYYNDGDCRKFRCSDRNKAFPNENTHKCEPCSTGVRGGASKNTGVCKKCDLGQYFDSNTETCKPATGLSKSDLQYGKNKSNEGNPKDQCWTKTDPDAYRCCVLKTSAACNAASSKGTNTTSGYVNDFSSFREVSFKYPVADRSYQTVVQDK